MNGARQEEIPSPLACGPPLPMPLESVNTRVHRRRHAVLQTKGDGSFTMILHVSSHYASLTTRCSCQSFPHAIVSMLRGLINTPDS
jgi:hypothetical protein